MRIELITVFPELFAPFFEKGMVGQAVKAGLLEPHLVNPRSYASDNHKSVDDRPYGGGDGMVMLPEVMSLAIKAIPKLSRKIILLSPQGERLNDKLARELSLEPGFILVCARYGGIDERFISQYVDQEISVGDYVLCGGEVAAMCLIEATARFVPGVLGNAESAAKDSFSDGLLEAPLYTRPPVFEDLPVPEVLTSGHHQHINEWKRKVSLVKTHMRRPDLIDESDESQKEALKRALIWYSGLSPKDKQVMNLDVQKTR